MLLESSALMVLWKPRARAWALTLGGDLGAAYPACPVCLASWEFGVWQRDDLAGVPVGEVRW